MTGPTSAVLERAEGGYVMVALDQRESMRDLLEPRSSDADLRRFKADAARALSSTASAVLLDRPYGLDDEPPAWTATTPLILAADHFRQAPGAPVQDSTLDPEVTPQLIDRVGASAVKFLALWRSGDDAVAREDLVRSFVGLARAAGVPAVVEGIVRPDAASWRDRAQRDDAIVTAAAELSGYGADLYKAEVPGDPSEPGTVTEAARRISDAVQAPWVVLSNGVPPELFADAVEAACAGGASGFLAGRAIWTSAARATDRGAALRNDAPRRLAAAAARVPATRAVMSEGVR